MLYRIKIEINEVVEAEDKQKALEEFWKIHNELIFDSIDIKKIRSELDPERWI